VRLPAAKNQTRNMLRKILLPAILVILGIGFVLSPEFNEIAAGVAIFLVGMLALEEGFKTFTGGVLQSVLRRSTSSLWKSLGFGVVTTTLMQSSSLVSVITISFLSAGLIGLTSGIGIIFGANLGTTTGAWLVAGVGLKVDIAAYAMPLIVFGVVLMFQRSTALAGLGRVLTGVGFLFLGIAFMKDGFAAVQDTMDLARFSMTGLAGLLVYTAIGIAATVVMQSSHATLIIAIAALAAGQISYENSLAIAIGSNVGTTITALLGAISANAAGKRLALAHLIFNLVTAAVALVLITPMATAVDGISSAIGIAAGDFTLKFAVFHSLFNVVGIVLMVPLIGQLVAFLERAVPEVVPDVSRPRHLNEAALELPDTALAAIVAETRHLANNARDLAAESLGLSLDDIDSDKDLSLVVAHARSPVRIDFDDVYQRRIKGLTVALVEFMSRAEGSMVPEQIEVLDAVKTIVREIVQAVKDMKHLQKNLPRYLTSDNAHIREEYNTLRLSTAKAIRAFDRVGRDPESSLAQFAELKSELKGADIVAGGEVSRLLRESRITGEMATSLINDGHYARHFCKKLTRISKLLLKDETRDQLQALLQAARDEAAEDEAPVPDDEAHELRRIA